MPNATGMRGRLPSAAGRTLADVVTAFDTNGIWYERVQDYEDLRSIRRPCTMRRSAK